ncbi:MAG: IclR family transcriptional regulator [Nitratireductor sp.]|nr:IclR family transcriptional regulator [Nitratireductor sp.]
MGTISKALDLLNFFSRRTPEIGLGEFVRLSGRDKATVYRHLVELEANGFLEQDARSRAYRLGPAVLRLAGVREATHPVRSLLRPIVEQLARDTGELAHVSLLQGRMLSPICHYDPHLHGTRVNFNEAEMLPLHATSSGVAVLAFSPRGLLDKVLAGKLKAYSPHTITDPQTLTDTVRKAAAQGFSQMGRGFDEEVTSQAAPVFDTTGEAIGAISVALPMVRAEAGKLRTIAAELVAAANAASHLLGGSRPAVGQPALDRALLDRAAKP